jgi:hypothetical protein
MNKGVEDTQDRAYKQGLLDTHTQDPTEFRALDMQARAAGYQPGTEGYQHFMRVRGGIDSKASNAGYKFDTQPGADGKPRVRRMNPNTGMYEIYDESAGDFVPVGAPTVPSSGVAPMSGGGGSMLHDAIRQVESGGNPNAVSPKGAMGAMQVMPNTLRDPGFGVTPARDNSPAEMERVGRDYFDALLQKYGGNQQMALAAYNAGPGRMDGLLAANGNDPS